MKQPYMVRHISSLNAGKKKKPVLYSWYGYVNIDSLNCLGLNVIKNISLRHFSDSLSF